MPEIHDVGTWLGIAATSATALGAIARLVGSNRLRTNLKRDAELYALLPDGDAKASVGTALDRQAEQLQVRIVDGRQLSRRQRGVGYAVVLLTTALGLLLLAPIYHDRTDALGSIWRVIELSIVVGVGLIIGWLIFAAMESATDWLDRKARVVPTTVTPDSSDRVGRAVKHERAAQDLQPTWARTKAGRGQVLTGPMGLIGALGVSAAVAHLVLAQSLWRRRRTKSSVPGGTSQGPTT